MFIVFVICLFVAYISSEKEKEREKIKARKIWEGILFDQEEKEREEKEKEERDEEGERDREREKEREKEKEREREKERIWSKESRDQVSILSYFSIKNDCY